MEETLTGTDSPIDLRERAKGAAKWFNDAASWMPLALALREIKQRHAYRPWGFSSLSSYAEGELDLAKSVTSELLLAVQYLAHRHPECVASRGSAAELIPSWGNLVILARNAKHLPESVVEALDQALFAGTIKRQALREGIAKALQQRHPEIHPARMHARQAASLPDDQPLLVLLQEWLTAFDLDALREQVTLVFEGWEEASLTDRRQLLSRVCALLDRVEQVKRRLGLTRI